MSVIRFFSEAGGEVIMLRGNVAPILQQAGIIFHNEGAFLSEDLSQITKKIETTINEMVAIEQPPTDSDFEELDEEKKQKIKDFVSLRIRFYPLLELCNKALKKGKHVYWTTL